MSESYEIISAALPQRVRATSNIYDEIVTDFIAKDVASALVRLHGRKVATVYLQLRKAATRHGGVSVAQRSGDVYLVKK